MSKKKEGRGPLVHGPVGRRQVHARRGRRAEAARPRQARSRSSTATSSGPTCPRASASRARTATPTSRASPSWRTCSRATACVVLAAAISPFRETREKARALIGDFVEVHVAPPLEECIKRDVKGLYQKAIAGEIKQFTGISDPYEEPRRPSSRIDTAAATVDDGAARILGKLRELGYLERRRRPPQSAGALTRRRSVMAKPAVSAEVLGQEGHRRVRREAPRPSRAARSTPSSSARSACCAASTASGRRDEQMFRIKIPMGLLGPGAARRASPTWPTSTRAASVT